MPFDLSPAATGFMAVAFLVAAFVRGYSGFGFSALIVASSALVTNPLHFVAVVMICEFMMTFQQARGVWHVISWWRVLTLMLGALMGVPLGLWALTGIAPDAARAVISGYVLAMCFVLLAGWKLAGEARGISNLAAGVVSGLANAPGMGGLPIAAYFAAQPMRAAVFRATLIAYFPLLDLYSAPLYWYAGLVSWDTLWASLIALPLTFLGNWLGSRHFLKTDPQEFRRFAILLLAGLAGLGLVKAVM